MKNRCILIMTLIVGFASTFTPNVNADDLNPLEKNNYTLTENERLNLEWAQKLSQGGYIVHFRHAQREQWNDVFAFDAYELRKGIDASKSSFFRATCLTDQGKEEAKLLGKILRLADVKFSEIISSPSCRARQTSLLAFKRIDGISNSLLHRSAIMKIQHSEFDNELRKLLISLQPKPGSNIALVGHTDTLVYSGNSVLDMDAAVNINVEGRDPTGFVILEKIGTKIYPRYVFKSMKDFSLASLGVPVTKIKSNK